MILELNQDRLKQALEGADEGILDGRAVAGAVREQLEPLVTQLRNRQIQPTLSVVQVGDDEASTLYIEQKTQACEEIGIRSQHHRMARDVSQPELAERLHQLNADPTVHGVLVQLPLPAGLDELGAMTLVDPAKDVDGFHPVNLGCLMTRRALLEPCTPTGVINLLRAAGVDPGGRRAVVVGRSVIVGRPMALMLARADATVTLCHRHTRDLDAVIGEAEILVMATGVGELCKGEWIREGAVVIDVGISRKDGRLTGDVEFEEAKERARLITPVPGGVGPMTVASLLANTIRATCIHENYLVRNGDIIATEQADVHYDIIDGLRLTRLREGRPTHPGARTV